MFCLVLPLPRAAAKATPQDAGVAAGSFSVAASCNGKCETPGAWLLCEEPASAASSSGVTAQRMTRLGLFEPSRPQRMGTDVVFHAAFEQPLRQGSA